MPPAPASTDVCENPGFELHDVEAGCEEPPLSISLVDGRKDPIGHLAQDQGRVEREMGCASAVVLALSPLDPAARDHVMAEARFAPVAEPHLADPGRVQEG